MLLLLATTTLEKLQAVPSRFWINAAIFIFGGWITVLLVRHAAKMNRLVLAMIIGLILTTVGFQWIYERNEPDFLTPYVDLIAPFFPHKGMF